MELRRQSGSKGMLGMVLEKMHGGEILSQHEVSAALKDYNDLQSKLATLQQKAKVGEVSLFVFDGLDFTVHLHCISHSANDTFEGVIVGRITDV